MSTARGIGSDMNQRPRYELKMVCQESAYDRLLMLLRLHSSCLRSLYPARQVQSIYLDTHTCRALEDNIAGISHREKFRFRWYGPRVDRIHGRIEKKVRENMLGWKEIHDLREEINLDNFDRYSFIEWLAKNTPMEFALRISQGLEPVQWISYHRQYYITANAKVRVTLDRDLESYDLRSCLSLSNKWPTRLPRILILEVKCSSEDYEYAQEFVRSIPLPVDKSSKFVLACQQEHGPTASIL